MIARTASAKFRLALTLCLAALASSDCSKVQSKEEQPIANDQDLARANDDFAAERYEKAKAEYGTVLRAAPNDPTATVRLGIIYYDEGQIGQAFPLLNKAGELQPDNPDVQLRLGLGYLAVHALADARHCALQILEKQPGYEDALLLLADTAATPNDLQEAQTLIESLREKDSDRPAYHLALGQIALRQNDPGRAENELKAAQALGPNSSALHFAWANLHWARNDLKAAEQEFKTAADLAPLRSVRRLRYADFKLQTGAGAEAKAILEGLAAKAPDYLLPRVYLMKVACAEHFDEDCAARVQNILLQDDVNYDALLALGNIHLAKGDTAKAVRVFQPMSEIYPHSPEVRYRLAVAHLQSTGGHSPAVEAAANSLEAAVNLDPHFDDAIVLLAQLRIRKEQFAAASDSLAAAIKERPQVPEAYLLLASAYLSQHHQDQALAVYRQMEELFPKDPRPAFLIGLTQLKEGQQQAARTAFEQSLEVYPGYLPALENLVDLDIADKQYVPALDRIQKQVDRNPKLAQLWAIRGKIYLAQQDYAHAEPALLTAIELDSTLEGAYLLLAKVYVASNRQEQAVERLAAFTDKTADVPALMQLAMIQEQLKHYDQASDAYQRILKANPNFLPARNNLAHLDAERLARNDEADDPALRARNAFSDDPHSADTLGWTSFKRGAYDIALGLLQESASKLPDEPEVQFHLGMTYYMIGKEALARQTLQKAAEATSEFPDKNEALRRLSLLAIDPKTANPAARTKLENQLRESPNDPIALARLAQLQYDDGVIDQALQTYQTYEGVTEGYRQFYRAYPDDPQLTKTLGILSYRGGKYEQSALLLENASAKLKDDSELEYYLGMADYHLGQYPETKRALQRALSLNLSGKLADEARQALAECCQEQK